MMRRVGAMAGLVGVALGTVACSNTPDDTPQAAMNMLLGGLNNCGVTMTTSNIADPRPLNEGGTRAVDGDPVTEESEIIADVRCSVVEREDGGFDVSGTVTAGPNLTVSLLEPIRSGGQALATMATYTPPATSLQSTDATPCTVSTDPSFGRMGKFDVIPGAIFAGFTCAEFIDPSSPDRVCSASGTFIFENCSTK